MIAIHAWRSAKSIHIYRKLFPNRPLIIGLGGTDVNTYLKSDPQTTLGSMAQADALICLHDMIGPELPGNFRRNLYVVKQSARPLPKPRSAAKRFFDISVIGHLREEKDPFRTALAVKRLGSNSRIRITHLGKAHSPEFAQRAITEMAATDRYRWLGEVPGWRVRRELARTRLMVISSNQEGGANVVSEAIVAGVPVIASDISGNKGVLGADYPAYYPVRDDAALARLLTQAETEPEYLRLLQEHGRKIEHVFQPEYERLALEKVVKIVTK